MPSIEFKPLRRCLVKIGGRKGKNRQARGLYNFLTQEIILKWAWYQREKHLEADVENVIEHKTLHHVLARRISFEASEKFDNLPYLGSGRFIFLNFSTKIVQQSKMQRCQNSKMKRDDHV